MRRLLPTVLAVLAPLALLAPSGCGDDGGNAVGDLAVAAPGDAAVPPAADLTGSPPDMGCWSTPMTHVEILNACTTAQSVDKVPVTPKLNPDGTLPPLP